jgi:general secretion pathway protein I
VPANESTADARDGFTLIEVIVAFLVLATVLGSATVSISYSSKLYSRADEIRMAGELAERLIAEKFDHRSGQGDSEAGTNGVLHWRIARHLLASDFTAAGGRLIGFDLTILDRRGQVLDQCDTIYVERQP